MSKTNADDELNSGKHHAVDNRPIAPVTSHAHHIHEFGEIDRIVHVEETASSAAEEEEPVLPISVKSPYASNERWRRLRRRLYRPRHLMQYFYNGVLYRTVGIRKVTTEELFLDLVIVAAVAALGHELRESEIGWSSIEKFILLFSALYASWREVVSVWNLWGTHQDLVEKLGIYLTFVAITGIAAGAHNAFDNVARPFVAVSSFFASAIPIAGNLKWSLRERLLKNPANRINQNLLIAGFALMSTLPYLIAAFVRSSQATRALYWAAFIAHSVSLPISHYTFTFLHRKIPTYTRLAVNIELFVEKFEVLTMIVMGETMIGLLYEAGASLTQDGVRVGFMYLSAIIATATLYSLQTLYVQVDSPIQKGGKHAIRHNSRTGFVWSYMHMPYHFCLILFATGLSISLRDVALPPSSDVARLLVRAADSGSDGGAQFTRSARWLYSVGWGGSVICSAIIGALHIPGPRAATKLHRIAIRCLLAIAIMMGLPFSNLSAEWFQGVIGIVSVTMALLEFLFVQLDRIGFFRSEATPFSSTDTDGQVERVGFDTDSMSDSDDFDTSIDTKVPKSPGEVHLSVNEEGGQCSNDEYVVALKERLCKGHCSRLVPVRPKEGHGFESNIAKNRSEGDL